MPILRAESNEVMGQNGCWPQDVQDNPLDFCSGVEFEQFGVGLVGIGAVAQKHIDQIVQRIHPQKRSCETSVTEALPRREVTGGA